MLPGDCSSTSGRRTVPERSRDRASGPSKPADRAGRSIPPTTTVAAAVSTAAAITTASGSGDPRLGFVHREPPSVVLLLVEPLDRRLGLGVGTHLDEPKPLAAARVTVGDHLGALHCPVLGEPLFQIGVGHGIGQISNIQFLSHWSSPCGKDSPTR